MGNGRAGALLKNGFIAQNLGKKHLVLQSNYTIINMCERLHIKSEQVGNILWTIRLFKRLPFLLMSAEALTKIKMQLKIFKTRWKVISGKPNLSISVCAYAAITLRAIFRATSNCSSECQICIIQYKASSAWTQGAYLAMRVNIIACLSIFSATSSSVIFGFCIRWSFFQSSQRIGILFAQEIPQCQCPAIHVIPFFLIPFHFHSFCLIHSIGPCPPFIHSISVYLFLPMSFYPSSNPFLPLFPPSSTTDRPSHFSYSLIR